MKKIFFLSAAFVFFGANLVFAQTEIIKLYDSVLSLPGCKAVGSNSCAELDGTLKSDVKKIVSVKRFVPGSGYAAVYFADLKPNFGAEGGFEFSQVYFEPESGGRVVMGDGMQLFERGNIVVEFTQPYVTAERLEIQYDLAIYYLPHSDAQRQQFLGMLQADPDNFIDYKEKNKNNIDPLCQAVKTLAKVPSACPAASVTEESDSSSGWTSNPAVLPELNFSGNPIRRPLVELENNERLAFVGEPVKITVNNVYDPDGKCQFFAYKWQRSDGLVARDVSVDPYVGDLSFVPENTGAFTLTFQAKEACKELGTLSSARVDLRLIVNDKSVIFPDINQAPGYQNAIYQLYHLGVLKGYPDGLIRPNELVNRAEFLKMILETLQYRIDRAVFSPRYPDVLPDDWFAYYVWQADTLGVIKGYVDGFFRPGRNVNLAESLKMVMNFSTLEIMDSEVYQFSDMTSEDWYSRYVQTAFREGILDDIEPGKPVKAWQSITRGKAALIIVRTLLFPVNRINATDKDVLRSPEEFVDFSSFDY